MDVTNLAALLVDHPAADGEGLLHTIDTTMTAGDARAAAETTAAAIRDAGVAPGQAVAVQLPNGPEAVTAMVGTWLAGCVYVPVNPRFPPPEVVRVVTATEPAALLTPGGLDRRGPGRAYPAGTAFVLWTSGTTGAPKPVLHTHEGYLELLDRVLIPLRGGSPPTRPAPNLIPVSLALNAGLYNALFGLRAGAALVIMGAFSTAAFATLVRRFSIRSTVLPPAAITMLNDSGIEDLTPLRYVRSITAPLSPLQARRFTTRFGVTVLNSYGQAEIGEVIGWTAADARQFPTKVGAAGRPLPGVDVDLRDGRLWVRPPNQGSGLGGRVDERGFVDTGDVARIDEEGFVWIEGRAGEMINRGGNKVFPAEVEEVIRLAPGVTDAGVTSAPDERLGQVPVAYYTGGADPAALEAVCREHLVPYKVPVAFHHVTELPRNEAGKLLRDRLGPRPTGGPPDAGRGGSRPEPASP